MITLRRSSERGHVNHDWLDTHHTFSFGEYLDARFMGFGPLRVINEDRVRAGHGFGQHPHRDMEIVTYVLEGAPDPGDSMGNKSVIRPGEVQRMTAGTGIMHSERNASPSSPVHFLQIWIVPHTKGLPPGYEQKAFPESERRNGLRLVASPDGRDGSVTIHQDATLSIALLASKASVQCTLAKGRMAWIHVARGEVTLNGQRLEAGDGASMEDESTLNLTGVGAEDAEVLVFDLAA